MHFTNILLSTSVLENNFSTVTQSVSLTKNNSADKMYYAYMTQNKIRKRTETTFYKMIFYI